MKYGYSTRLGEGGVCSKRSILDPPLLYVLLHVLVISVNTRNASNKDVYNIECLGELCFY